VAVCWSSCAVVQARHFLCRAFGVGVGAGVCVGVDGGVGRAVVCPMEICPMIMCISRGRYSIFLNYRAGIAGVACVRMCICVRAGVCVAALLFCMLVRSCVDVCCSVLQWRRVEDSRAVTATYIYMTVVCHFHSSGIHVQPKISARYMRMNITHTYIYAHEYISIQIKAYIYIHLHTHKYMYIRICMKICIYTYIYIHIHMYTNIYVYTCMHICICVHIYIHL